MSSPELSESSLPSNQPPQAIGSGLIVHGLAWCLVIGLLAFVVPRFEAIFNDFGVDLPVITKLTVKASHFLVGFVPIAIIFLAMDGVVRANSSRNSNDGGSRGWLVLMLALPFLAILFILASVGITLISLSTKLSG